MRKMWKGVCILALTLSACATGTSSRSTETSIARPEATPPSTGTATGTAMVEPSAITPPSDVSLDYFDSRSFDKKLSSELRQDPPAATVRFLATVTVNDIPERLEAWLATVEKYDGTVSVEVDPSYRSRSIIMGAISIAAGAFVKLYQSIAEARLYGPAKDYDATIYHDGSTGKITRVVFTRKAAGS